MPFPIPWSNMVPLRKQLLLARRAQCQYQPICQQILTSVLVKTESIETKVSHEGMAFTKHKSIKNNNQYHCSYWCSEKECCAVLKVFDVG
jgi:hypothetical protein